MKTIRDNLLATLGIFTLSLIIHCIGLNLMGRTWDEQFKVDMGYLAFNRIGAGDFSKDAWEEGEEHPMVAKYLYAAAATPYMQVLNPKTTTIYDLSDYASKNYIVTRIGSKILAVPYDFSGARFLSVILNSLAVTFVFLIGLRFLSKFYAAFAALSLLLIPRFVVMGQLVTFESLSLFLALASYFAFSKLLRNYHNYKYFILLGILCGLLFWTRYNNITMFIFLFGWWAWEVYKKRIEIKNPRLLIVPTIALLLGIAIWPLLWIDFPHYLLQSFAQNSQRAIGPSFYYLKHFTVTTPIPILAGLVIGIFFTLKKRSELPGILLWWLTSTLIFYSLLGVEGGGTRYAYLAYAPMVLLSAFGYSQILVKKWVYLLIPLIIYMIWEMITIFPYYLDYYNLFAGGTKNAYAQGYSVSWWGEGQYEAAKYLNTNAKKDATVGLILTPKYTYPNIRLDLINEGYITEEKTPDYVVVSLIDFESLTSNFKSKYKVMYTVQANGQPLVYVLEKKL